MASRFRTGSRKSVGRWFLATVATLATTWFMFGFGWPRHASRSIDDLESVVVRRADLDTVLLAGGDLLPVNQTTVSCHVEDITDSDGATILTLISNGAHVEKGDVLCRLDSSEFEELARQQEIFVNHARATCLQARLELETARIGLKAYQEGVVSQLANEFAGRIALGRSDAQRQATRLAWTEAMLAKGYLSASQRLTERQALERAQHELGKAEREFRLFQQFTVPKETKTLLSQCTVAEITFRVEADRLKAEEGQLAHLRKQIENCTIKAPHAGVVLHANRDRPWAPPLQTGDRVYQDEGMFRISDLTQTEVMVSVAESMGPKVKLGMKAKVHLASMAGRVLTGRVVAIDQLPSENWKGWDERVKHFVTRVRLDSTPPGAMMFMSASVEFETGRVPEALLIPVEAVSVIDRLQSCYVIGSNGLERRAITTRNATTALVEVTSGLKEGERVVSRYRDVHAIPVDDQTQDPASDVVSEYTVATSRPESPQQKTALSSRPESPL
jgi:HlyD family secretion protein